ncbi:hypothetical protein TSUD_260230 [Trifolium subterraneum]|uniref:Uncharacterized protein n=1 Tax=Trifolium subterraneum TaxID=3900 RepID=A0A2Z6N2I8_TRISU|nr:hypothetical protein TSUD_260230 [Trifolium subterraneum]
MSKSPRELSSVGKDTVLCVQQPGFEPGTLHLFTFKWNIPHDLITAFPTLSSPIDIVTIPLEQKEYQLLWNHTSSVEAGVQIVIAATLISIFNNIWVCRNNVRFKNIKPSLNSTIAVIVVVSTLTGNFTSLTSGPSISDFAILKYFKVSIHQPKALKIVEVIWAPPLCGWVKCNTDDTSVGNPDIAACADIFRNNNGANLGCFAHFIGPANACFAETMRIILAIECASDRN